MKGELIVYDIDDTHPYERIKIGDGVQNVNDLPFYGDGYVSYNEQELTDAQKAQARLNIVAPGYNFHDISGNGAAWLANAEEKETNAIIDWDKAISLKAVNDNSKGLLSELIGDIGIILGNPPDSEYAYQKPSLIENSIIPNVTKLFDEGVAVKGTGFSNGFTFVYGQFNDPRTWKKYYVGESDLSAFDGPVSWNIQNMDDSTQNVMYSNGAITRDDVKPSSTDTTFTYFRVAADAREVGRALALKADKTALDEVSALVGETAVSEQISSALENSGAVLYTEQALTDEQKAQARANIDPYKWYTLYHPITRKNYCVRDTQNTIDFDVAFTVENTTNSGNVDALTDLVDWAMAMQGGIYNNNTSALKSMASNCEALATNGALSSTNIFIELKTNNTYDNVLFSFYFVKDSETGYYQFGISENSIFNIVGYVIYNYESDEIVSYHMALKNSDSTLSLDNHYANAKATGDAINAVAESAKQFVVNITATTTDGTTTYSADKTFAEIDEAISKGKNVVACTDYLYYPLVRHQSNGIVLFSAFEANTGGYIGYLISAAGIVIRYDGTSEKIANRVSSIDENNTTTVNYPSTQAVVDYAASKTDLEAISALVGDTSVSEQINTAITESVADWNQNDETATDYIKNRPFYEDGQVEIEIVAETTVEFANEPYAINPFEIKFVEGQTYFVTWDGTVYECVSYIAPGPNSPSIGNGSIAGAGDSSNEPFFCTVFEGNVMLFAEEVGTYTISISTIEPNIHHIDPKYIKDMYYEGDLVEKEFMPEMAVENTEGYIYETDFLNSMLEEGLTYIVTWNGEQYTCVARNVGDGGIYIGNQAIAIDADGFGFAETIESNEPFFILTFAPDMWSVIMAESGSHTFSINVIRRDLRQIDPKYIPSTNLNVYISYEEDETLFATHSSADIFKAKESGRTVEFYDGDGIKYDFDGGDPSECYFKCVSLWYDQAATRYACIYSDKTIEFYDNKYVPATDRIEAKVGQTIVVKEIDENGMPISWEAVDRHRFDVITLTDEVNGYEYIVKMQNGTLTTVCRTDKISVTTMPTKTEYLQGESFDPTGMVVMATRQDGSTYEVDMSTYTEPVLETPFTISYIEAGIVYSTTVDLTVNEFDPAVQLIDFDYYQEDNGTYYITGWKGTLNGVQSTELIVPDSALVKI